MRTSNRLASHTFHEIFTLLLAAACLATLPARSVEPTVLRVDARDISQRILHATLHIPAQPGPLTLVYPK